MPSPNALRIDSRGRTVDDLHTIGDCDVALQSLLVTVDELRSIPEATRSRAQRQALRFRQLAVQRVEERRQDLRDNRLIAILERLEPELVAHARSLTA